jgi:diacylglycerol kinase
MIDWNRLLRSFKYAFQGLKWYWREGNNARFHTYATVLVLVFAYILNVSKRECCVLLICVGMVHASELFNTSIELLSDKISLEKNDMSMRIKDLAAAGVLMCSIVSALVALIIFLPKIYFFFFT